MVTLVEREERILAYWKDNKINEKVREKNRGKRKFYFLDGPPYVTGDLHPGQMWVKTVKDIFLRYRRYRGFDVRDRAGYDVHGLPIENKVEKLLGIGSKKDIEAKIGIEEFVRRCREYVDSFMGRMDKDYMRFGMSLNFENPYLAYRNEFIETAWGILKRINENGFLYRGKKTTAFCTHCETALAQGSMEVAYGDSEDPSIFVAFKVDREASSAKVDFTDNTYLLIWTTTPWTLPANVAVAANPKALYVLANAGGRDLIIAKQRLEAVANEINENVMVKAEFYGSELDGTAYVSPLEGKVPMQKELRRAHRVIFSEELVSLGDGTGLVHIAPGHGLDDYALGLKNKMPIFSPVAPNGVYTGEAGDYKGIAVPKEANRTVLKDLEAAGSLLGGGTVKHSYPQCWRCDTKLIYIATEQWFFDIQKVKDRLIDENRKVLWHPAEAQGWLADVLGASPDWCISRQRYWGIPLPIWVCSACKETSIIGSVAELGEMGWEHKRALSDLHRPHIDKVVLKCAKCGGDMKRIPDVVDVWYDASIAFRASMTQEEFERMFPVDYILEGKDQLRGWFSYLLKTSVMAYGARPYTHVGVDGMLLDEHGREMHKKLGNYVGLDEIAKSPGADVFRLWCADHTPWLDLNWNTEELKEAGKVVMVLDNISNLISEYTDALGYKADRKEWPAGGPLAKEDEWILSRMESTVENVTAHLDNYEAYSAAAAIKTFVMEDFSRFYLKLAKKRILYGDKDAAKAIIDIINFVLARTLVLISPITPFVAEGIYQERYKARDSIFLEDWPAPKKDAMNKDLEAQMEVAKDAITALLSSREKSGIALRWPIAKETLEVNDDSAYSALERLGGIVETCTNSKKLVLKRSYGIGEEVRPVFAKIGPDFKEKANAVAKALRGADAAELRHGVEKNGHYSLHTEAGTVNIRQEHFLIVQIQEQGEAAMFEYGKAYVDREMSRELMDEALVREFERRIQIMRKELRLKKADRIALHYEAAGGLGDAIRGGLAGIKRRLNVARMEKHSGEGSLTREFEIEGAKITVSVKKLP